MHQITEDTPQGDIISPLLANLVGGIIDKKSERYAPNKLFQSYKTLILYKDANRRV